MITKKQYVDRLEKMLETVDDLCETCPARTRFWRTGPDQRRVKRTHLKNWSLTGGCIDFQICRMCKDFVGLNYGDACPCYHFKIRHINVRTEALNNIANFRSGKHKWNREETK